MRHAVQAGGSPPPANHPQPRKRRRDREPRPRRAVDHHEILPRRPPPDRDRCTGAPNR